MADREACPFIPLRLAYIVSASSKKDETIKVCHPDTGHQILRLVAVPMTLMAKRCPVVSNENMLL
jgi:hypothetical protein